MALQQPERAAKQAGLVYVTDEVPGIARKGASTRFSYRDTRGGVLRDKATLARIRSLAIPPAWTSVWICPRADGHIQATGRDARRRKQYRYHPDFREVREGEKYEHILDFARSLPRIRRTVARHMAKPGLPREKVLAAVTHLLDTTLIRVGNADYAQQNKSYGLTTLLDRHAAIQGAELRFMFTGKSGKTWKLKIKDRRLAKIVKATQDLPGQHLFQYLDADGQQREVTSGDLNAYLREISGAEISAKNFRTWAGTVLAASALCKFEAVESEAAAKRNIRDAIEEVAQCLGNTPTVCRKCYVHPEVLEAYRDASLRRAIDKSVSGLSRNESMVLALLHARLSPKRKLCNAA